MAVTLLFFVNAGILFYIALIVSFDLQFCKINGIGFCRNKKIFSKSEQTPSAPEGELRQEFKNFKSNPEGVEYE